MSESIVIYWKNACTVVVIEIVFTVYGRTESHDDRVHDRPKTVVPNEKEYFLLVSLQSEEGKCERCNQLN